MAFQVSQVPTRYFELKFNFGDGSDITIHVEPPKMKTLRKLTELYKSDAESSIQDTIDVTTEILSKNKEHKDVSSLVEDLDIDELLQVLTAFMQWVNGEREAKN